MKVADFDYELPRERIAQAPAAERDAARLLVHEVAADATRHRRVRDLPDELAAADLVVVNDTRVLPTRLYGHRRSGGAVEFLFVESLDAGDPLAPWRVFANPARKLHPGEEVPVEARGGVRTGALVVRLLEREVEADGRPGMAWIAALAGEPGSTIELLERHGEMPLPHYIERDHGGTDAERALDHERYQTVFAAQPGAVAAPTAGLHFTTELLARLAARGVELANVTLHVGPGTFRPVKVEDVEDHRMHAERFHLPQATVDAVERARVRGGRVVAVGTTTVRVLESVADADGVLRPTTGSTDLFLRPGSRFRVVDALLTNFHLPRSSLLMLVSAFAGRERILRLYQEAIARAYRFTSYGDAMLLLGRPSGGAEARHRAR